MALRTCKECGNEVSTSAAACPKCGAVLKRKRSGCVGCFGAIAIVALWCFAFPDGISPLLDAILIPSSHSAQRAGNKPEPAPKIHKEGETVHIGYTAYAVWRSWWSDQLSEKPFLDQRPNAAFLFVELTVRNNDDKARMVPPFKLLDEKSAEYEASSNSCFLDGAIGILESLNPSVSKQGTVVFDVPRNHSYRLKLSGGFWSSEDAYVQLTPKKETTKGGTEEKPVGSSPESFYIRIAVYNESESMPVSEKCRVWMRGYGDFYPVRDSGWESGAALIEKAGPFDVSDLQTLYFYPDYSDESREIRVPLRFSKGMNPDGSIRDMLSISIEATKVRFEGLLVKNAIGKHEVVFDRNTCMLLE